MPQSIQLEVEVPGDLARFRLPEGVQHRLLELLDKQDAGPVRLAPTKSVRLKAWWIWRTCCPYCGCGRSG